MGNQSSGSATTNKRLSTSDVKKLRQQFSHGKLTRLPESWDILDNSHRTFLLKNFLDSGGGISFEKYQNFAGDIVKGTLEDKSRCLLGLIGPENRNLKHFKMILIDIFKGMAQICAKNKDDISIYKTEAEYLADSILHDLVHKDSRRKATFKQPVEESLYEETVDESIVENLMAANPLVEHIVSQVFAKCFQLKTTFESSDLALPYKGSFCSALCFLFLNFNIPHKLRNVWRPIFSTRSDGESFSKFIGSLVNRGPTVIIIKDNEGNVFGGFCSENWRLGPNFIGSEDCFLFHLQPAFNVYDSTPFNKNFQYLNTKQKTMPNGLGQGGQLNYFAYWIDSEFGRVSTAPSCTTFHSPQLGVQDGQLVELEVWGVGPEPDQEELGGDSVLNVDPEAQAVMEMMGKTFHSKAIREVDAKDAELDKKLEEFGRNTGLL